MTDTQTQPQPGDKMPDGTIYADISPDWGAPMRLAPCTDTLTIKWKAARSLNAHAAYGYKDWRRPSESERAVLFNNRAKLGGDAAVADARVRIDTGMTLMAEIPRPPYPCLAGYHWVQETNAAQILNRSF